MIFEPIHSQNAPKAVGPYSPALQAGDFICLSGQLPIDPSTGKMVEGDIRVQTRQCLKNLEAVLNERGLDLSYIMMVRVYLSDMGDFAGMNEVYAQMFKEPYPARLCVGVSLLNGAKGEIEAFAMDTRALEVICAGDGCSCCAESDHCEGAKEK